MERIFNFAFISMLLVELCWISFETIKNGFSPNIFGILIATLTVFIAFQQWLTNEKSRKYQISDKVTECHELLYQANGIFFRTRQVTQDCYNKYIKALTIAQLYLSSSTIKAVKKLHDLGKEAYIQTKVVQDSHDNFAKGRSESENQVKRFHEANITLKEIFESIQKIDKDLYKIFRKYIAV